MQTSRAVWECRFAFLQLDNITANVDAQAARLVLDQVALGVRPFFFLVVTAWQDVHIGADLGSGHRAQTLFLASQSIRIC